MQSARLIRALRRASSSQWSGPPASQQTRLLQARKVVVPASGPALAGPWPVPCMTQQALNATAKDQAMTAGEEDRATVGEVLSGGEVAGVKIEGISVAGQETCIILPQFNVVFDTGRCPQRSVFQRHVLISHAHLDHIGGLAHHICTRDMQGLNEPIVLVPEVIAAGTRTILDAYKALDGCDYACTITPCKVDQPVPISSSVTVHPFETAHVIPSLGYVLTSTKKKLKPSLLGLPGPEIKRLKDAGEEIQDYLTTAEVAFTGDTTIEFLRGQGAGTQLALSAKLLIMELTFLDDSVPAEKARKRGHMHITDFIENAERFKDNHSILLIHVSARYSKDEALRLLNEKLPESLRKKCSVLLEGFRSS